MFPPSGTVTFLFTDIEGSTRRWEADTQAMRLALAVHDQVLRAAVEAFDGYVFKHTGDGIAAAFGSARAAVAAAVQAQRDLELPVRMGIASGEAEERDGDYFGPVVNRAARVMAAGHGGQVLVSGSAAMLVSGVDLVDLGEHRLRDLPGLERVYQVRAPGLSSEFAPLRTVDPVPGNLPVLVSSLIGRQADVRQLVELVRTHRLVTLVGVGGVGKTRLALQVAAELVSEFPAGVWLVELAPVSDPNAVADVVASVLGVTPRAHVDVGRSIADALSGRQLLIVLDNCEHVLDAAAHLVGTVLTNTELVKVLATSREGLRMDSERLWPVPSLTVRDAQDSSAVELFVERARAVHPGFDPGRAGPEFDAVIEICRRLDGVALAIELAAARLVSMTVQDVRDRLGDRFRLLSGGRRGLERHQTLRNAVAWSFELLDPHERRVLSRCSVFADGFDLRAATHVCGDGDDAGDAGDAGDGGGGGGGGDEYEVLDVLDSLVRKSLMTVDRAAGHARYGILETIRQFAEEQLVATGDAREIRDRHAGYYGERAVAHWELWDGPRQRLVVDWVDAEFANLRAAFGWAADHDLPTAAAIAAHTTFYAYTLQRFEPISWVEQLLATPGAAELALLPRLYTAASVCQYTGRVDAALRYVDAAVALEDDPRFDPFEREWTRIWKGYAHRLAGDDDEFMRIVSDLLLHDGLGHVWASSHVLYLSPAVAAHEADEARAEADETIRRVRAHGNPYYIAFAAIGYGRRFSAIEPDAALATLHEALAFTRANRVTIMEAVILREIAALEAAHGDTARALLWFDMAIDRLHRAGNIASLIPALAHLTALFDRIGSPRVAATIFGGIVDQPRNRMVAGLPAVIDHLRAELGEHGFDQCVAAGRAMGHAEIVQYARAEIEHARSDVGEHPGTSRGRVPPAGRRSRRSTAGSTVPYQIRET